MLHEQLLVELFGLDTVEQASLLDVVDLNLDDKMTGAISAGVIRLKKLRGDTVAQQAMIAAIEPGERLLLCMWVMEMELLDRISEQTFRR